RCGVICFEFFGHELLDLIEIACFALANAPISNQSSKSLPAQSFIVGSSTQVNQVIEGSVIELNAGKSLLEHNRAVISAAGIGGGCFGQEGIGKHCEPVILCPLWVGIAGDGGNGLVGDAL